MSLKPRYSLEVWKNQQHLDKEAESHKVSHQYHNDQNWQNVKSFTLSFRSLETYWVWNEKAEMVRQVSFLGIPLISLAASGAANVN